MDFKKKFEPYTIAKPSIGEIKKAIPSYEKVLLSVLNYIIEAYEKDQNYPFFNTKIDTISGEELHHEVGMIDLYGKETIYGWIQGRGLEAVGGHYLWLKNNSSLNDEEKDYFMRHSLRILKEVSSILSLFRQKNNGRLSFWMDINGNAFSLDKDKKKKILCLSPDEAGFSDIFSVKGLIMSAFLIGDKKLEMEAKNYYETVIHCIRSDRFRTDQENLNPKNKEVFVQGKISHAPRMIAIGMCILFYELYHEPQYINDGFDLINDIFSAYVNYDEKFQSYQKYDMPEFINPDGNPYAVEGDVIAFPGHIMELVGFIGKFFHAIEEYQGLNEKQKADIIKINSMLPGFFIHNFRLGFKEGYGMYNSISLDTRKPVNSDMPWWSLPETIRAAACLYRIAPEEQKEDILSILAETSNVFLKRYINAEVHCMAYQTLDEFGNPIRMVPATPDADPGYHTGLSIIDFMNICSQCSE